MPRLGTQPLAILQRGVMRHADRREPVAPHPETHLHVGLGRVRNRVGLRLGRARHLVRGKHEDFILIPRDLMLSHPEGRELDADLRALIGLTPKLRFRAAEREDATRNRLQCERHRRSRDRDRVGRESRHVFGRRRRRREDLFPNLPHEREFGRIGFGGRGDGARPQSQRNEHGEQERTMDRRLHGRETRPEGSRP